MRSSLDILLFHPSESSAIIVGIFELISDLEVNEHSTYLRSLRLVMLSVNESRSFIYFLVNLIYSGCNCFYQIREGKVYNSQFEI